MSYLGSITDQVCVYYDNKEDSSSDVHVSGCFGIMSFIAGDRGVWRTSGGMHFRHLNMLSKCPQGSHEECNSEILSVLQPTIELEHM